MSKKIVVIAHHHGAFLTLNSVFQDEEVEQLIVVIPNSQVEKYSGFSEKAFVDFDKNLKKFVRKHRPDAEIYVVDDSIPMSRFHRTTGILEELGEKGSWLVLLAGAIYNPNAEWAANIRQTIAACTSRCFSGPNDMYAMIGVEVNGYSSDVFYVNMDREVQIDIQKLPSTAFGRQDALIGEALSSVECLRWSAHCSKAVASSFWMKAISKKLTQDEYVAYPFDIMVPHAKATKKWLPEGAYNQILSNAEESAWYKDLRSTYL